MYFFYFYPLGLDQPLRRPPVLTYGLLALMTVLFLWIRYAPGLLPFHPAYLVFYPGNGAPWTVATAVFVHGGWIHLLGNLLYCWVFAPLLEDRLGTLRFLFYWVMLGAFGNLLHGLVSVLGVMGQGGLGVMGASGAIAGLLALSLVRFYYARLSLAYWVFSPLQGVSRAGRAYLPLPVGVGLWLLLQLMQSLLASESGSTVSYGAHLGGFTLGLFLAFVLGYHTQARAENHAVRGRRYLEQGQPLAAEGDFMAYLEQQPGDLEVTLLLARARRMSGRGAAARGEYQEVFRGFLERGRIDEALDVYREIRRGDSVSAVGPEDLAQVAFLFEKTHDYAAAVAAYLDLFQTYPSSDRSENALVRAILLFRDKLQDGAEARRWFAIARGQLPPGSWRDFLDREFRMEREARADPSPVGATGDPGSAT